MLFNTVNAVIGSNYIYDLSISIEHLTSPTILLNKVICERIDCIERRMLPRQYQNKQRKWIKHALRKISLYFDENQ